MSRENVELVRGAWAAVERGDLETALEIHAPDIEIDLSTGGRADAGVYRGREETTRAYETWVSPWESMVMEAKEFIDAADDQLVVHFEARGRSRQTGLEFALDRYWLYTLHDARVVSIREFETRAQALAAVVPG